MFTLYKVLTQKPEPPKEKKVDKGDRVRFGGKFGDGGDWEWVRIFFTMFGVYLGISIFAIPFLLLGLWLMGLI